MADKKTLSGRVAADTYDEFEDLADEHDVRKSDLLRRAAVEFLEDNGGGESDHSRTRSVSPLALIGVVALAIAPTLLATGYTTVGVAAGAVGAVYVLLWVTAYDVVVEDALDDARDELADLGGVVGFFRYVIRDDVVDDPDTVVERAANADLLGLGFLTGGLLVGAPAAALAHFGYLGLVLDLVGSTGATVYLAILVGLAYLGAALLGVSAVASLALASARVDASQSDDPSLPE